jgi:uridine phosphorylase
MSHNDAIVYPLKRKNSPDIGPIALMVAAKPDFDRIGSMISPDNNGVCDLFMGKLYAGTAEKEFSVAGPMIGAPYAVMILETLIAWGARKFLFFGWCGAISGNVNIGDIIIPTASIIDEGTSKHYSQTEIGYPVVNIQNQTKRVLKNCGIEFIEGTIWTTDGIYRETREKVDFYQSQGALAVEMETSALFSAGKFRDVAIGAILVVSDELSSDTWRPGFKDSRFKQSRKTVCEVVQKICRAL